MFRRRKSLKVLAASQSRLFELPDFTRGNEPMANFEVRPAMICPHCTEKGRVQTRQSKRKAGISGGKVVGAFLTAGISMVTPGVGLSRKEIVTEARCSNCRAEWEF